MERRGGERSGKDWFGVAVEVGLGLSSSGTARVGEAVLASRGSARRGVDGLGMAGYKPKGDEHMVYQWKQAAQVKADAQIAGCVCEELQNTVGLTAETLVEASREKTAPLHDCFEWHDKTAAEEYRKHQARHIIGSLVIVSEEQEPVRAFLSIERQSAIYESVNTIVQQEDKREKMLRMALMELKAFERKYAALTEFTTLFDAIDKMTEVVA
jgi:hypothetical protein